MLGNTEQEAYLWYLVSKGVADKYGDTPPKFVLDRIKMEMDVITNNNFTDYILMVWDIINFCNTPSRVFPFCAMNGIEPPPDGIIPIGPGRGSVGGSMVCYCIDIHECDPILFGLYFERFLNAERIAYPDIDFDISQRYRHIGIAYIASKYGREHVAQIITYGTLSTKTVIEEVLKSANVSLSQIKNVKAVVPGEVSFNDMLENDKLYEAFLKEMNNVIFPDTTVIVNTKNVDKFAKNATKNPLELSGDIIEAIKSGQMTEHQFTVKTTWTVQKAIDIMKSLVGLNKHESTHAGGVVVAPVTLSDNIPLLQKPEQPLACQWDMRSLEELGYLKMDVLGLRTVDVNHEANRLVQQWFDEDFDIKNIPLDDEQAIKSIRDGDTIGIFQVESSGFTKMMMDLDIGGYESRQRTLTSIEEMMGTDIGKFIWIAVGLALYRPGPLDAIIEGKTMVDHLIDRKNGSEPTTFLFPEEEEYLGDTYGVLVFQEQVMARVRQMTGCSYGRADTLRKAMGKKDKVLMNEQMEWFRENAMKHQFTSLPLTMEHKRQLVDRACEEIMKFARYGFNKAHTVEYAHICYRNAYLKTHYPACFYTAILNSESGDPNRLSILIKDMIKHGVKLLPPLINESNTGFTMTDVDTVRFGLAAISGLGKNGLKSILEEKRSGRFTSPENFKARIPGTLCNVNAFTNLAKAGAFDDMLDKCIMPIKNRATLVESAKDMCAVITKAGQKKGKNKIKPTPEQIMEKVKSVKYQVTEAEEDLILYATWEKKILNYFISAHPMDAYADEIRRWNAVTNEELEQLPKEFYIAGFIADHHETTIKKEGRNKGKKMGFVTVETEYKSYEATMFPGIWESCVPYIKSGNPVVMKGKKDSYKGALSIQGVYIRNMTNTGIRDCPECHIRLEHPNMLDLMEMRKIFDECPGITKVFIHTIVGHNDMTIECGHTVALNDRVINYCESIGRLSYKPN